MEGMEGMEPTFRRQERDVVRELLEERRREAEAPAAEAPEEDGDGPPEQHLGSGLPPLYDPDEEERLNAAAGAASRGDLYDEEADAADEEWRRGRLGAADSDATLSCPACFAVVCHACQRHETEKTRFRAVFVRGVRVHRKSGRTECSACGAELAWRDADGVYHFFQVLPS